MCRERTVATYQVIAIPGRQAAEAPQSFRGVAGVSWPVRTGPGFTRTGHCLFVVHHLVVLGGDRFVVADRPF